MTIDTARGHRGPGKPKREQFEWLLLGLLLGASFLLSAFFFHRDRALAEAAEQANLESQARIVELNLRHQLEGARGALSKLRRDWESGRPADAAALAHMRDAMPGARALLVQDPDGGLLAGSGEAPLPVAGLGAIAGGRPERLYIYSTRYRLPAASPDHGAAVATAALALTLPMAASDQHRAALATAIMDNSYFDVVMRSVLYAPDMHSALVDARGVVLLYAPPGSAAAGGGKGGRRLAVRRTFAPASLQLAAPFTILISRDVAAMQQPWLRLTTVYFSAWLLVALLASLVLWVLQHRRHAMRQSAALHLSHQRQHAARVELALAGADLGLWDWHFPSGTRNVDRRGAGMLGYTPREIDRIAIFYQHVHPDDVAAVQAALAQHLRGGSDGYQAEFRMRHRRNGWVWVHSRGKIVERDADGVPTRVVGTRMDITERKLAAEKIRRLAYYDVLTALPNRRLLLERLPHALSECARLGRHGALLFLDLDHFKQLNDSLGHDAGDLLLQAVALRLRNAVGASDTVARLGGDEFVILLEGLPGQCPGARRAVELAGQRILCSLARPHLLGGRQVVSTPSIGATVFSHAGPGLGQLLKQADLAMYQAKSGGRARMCFFEPSMLQRASESLAMKDDLRLALERSELALHYQVIVDANGATRGVEALLRWHHPRRGPVPPDQFIALAEQTGLIVPLGQWVLDQACRQLACWAGHPRTAGWSIAVNVSAQQFAQADFVRRVLDTVAARGAEPRRLKLELTESALLHDINDVVANMAALRRGGIELSLDDFGTGYSSLNYLKRLPLYQLKIDRSFVQDVLSSSSDAAIVRAIVALALSLGLEVVAEGVESEAQRRFLLDIGCHYLQGYLFGPAVPAGQLAGSGSQAVAS